MADDGTNCDLSALSTHDCRIDIILQEQGLDGLYNIFASLTLIVRTECNQLNIQKEQLATWTRHDSAKFAEGYIIRGK